MAVRAEPWGSRLKLEIKSFCAVMIAAGSVGLAAAQEVQPDLSGIWRAERTFGPEIAGMLMLRRDNGEITADIAGHVVPVQVRGSRHSFTLPGNLGSFRGYLSADRRTIRGFWTQPRGPIRGGAFDTPVTLSATSHGWRGHVSPLPERYTAFLAVRPGQDGRPTAFYRNLERNDGAFMQVRSIAQEGDQVKLIGNRRGGSEEIVLSEGVRRGSDRLSLYIPNRGGSFDFDRLGAGAHSAFYPRGNPPARYTYSPPVARNDGWEVGTLDDVGMDRGQIEEFVRSIIEAPMTEVGDSQIHSLLIARRGRLVLEEYFHGHHRDMAHDMRSASKSIVSVLFGAARHRGIPVAEATPVYATMLGAQAPSPDPRKREMTLGHLLTMRGGHFCDDSNPAAPGNEDVMQDQENERDWFRYILALPLDRRPGERLVYCSIDAHLAGGVIARVAGEPVPELFDRLIARPLNMGTYSFNLSPTGDAYMGGGAYFMPRDFLKLPQLILNGGRWAGRQVIGRDWARRSITELRDLRAGQQYGALWNSVEYPYRGRTVRAFFAAGNGGQIFMGIPELELVIGFTGGSYGDPSLYIPQRVLVPDRILPAVN